MKHFNIKIFGRVQMIFFRLSAKEKADNLGIRGFARNEPDGSVYIEVEGKPEALKRFSEWCKRGPALAQVERIEITENTVKKFTEFSIH